MSANKAINHIEGWTRVSETELTKVHNENGAYQVTVTSADNQQAEVEYVVKHIDKQRSKCECSKEMVMEKIIARLQQSPCVIPKASVI